jgi:hypothetical protein
MNQNPSTAPSVRAHPRRAWRSRATARGAGGVLVLQTLLLLGALHLPVPTAAATGNPQRLERATEIEAGFERHVTTQLRKPLWQQNTAYNSGHSLMLPLQAAFEWGRVPWQQQFANHFNEFVTLDSATAESFNPDQVLARVHYLFLASAFVSAAHRHGQTQLVPNGLAEKLYRELAAYYQTRPAWWYAPRSYKNGLQERVAERMKDRIARGVAPPGTRKPPNYYDGFADDAAFVMAGLANLFSWANQNKQTEAQTVSRAAATQLLEVLRVYGEFRDSGYVFQAGQWADHPDYAHAGHLSSATALPPKPVDRLAEDSSHSSRWPVFLQALRQALVTDSELAQLRRIERDWSRMFYGRVASGATPEFPCLRLTNYADGYNGLYRYGYSGRGEGFAYEPFMVSNVIFTGWWVFFQPDAAQFSDPWQTFHVCYPMQPKVAALYLSAMPKPAERQKIAESANWYSSDEAQFRSRLTAFYSQQALAK